MNTIWLLLFNGRCGNLLTISLTQLNLKLPINHLPQPSKPVVKLSFVGELGDNWHKEER